MPCWLASACRFVTWSYKVRMYNDESVGPVGPQLSCYFGSVGSLIIVHMKFFKRTTLNLILYLLTLS